MPMPTPRPLYRINAAVSTPGAKRISPARQLLDERIARHERKAAVAALPRFAAASSLPRFKAPAAAPKPKADLHVDLASKIRLERAGMGEAAIRRAVESAAAAKPRKPLTAAQLDIATRELMRRQPQLGYFAARDLIRRNG